MISSRFLLILGALVVATVPTANAKPWWLRGVDANQNDYLDPDVAFQASAALEGDFIRLHWIIADGYYLYRQKIEVHAESPDLKISAPVLPPGIVKVDPYFGRQEIYQRQFDARVAYSRFDGGAHPLQVKVVYQGCAEAGLCYPPITKVLYPHKAAAEAAKAAAAPSHAWEAAGVIAGMLAFLLAGAILRKGRMLERPAA